MVVYIPSRDLENGVISAGPSNHNSPRDSSRSDTFTDSAKTRNWWQQCAILVPSDDMELVIKAHLLPQFSLKNVETTDLH